MIKLPEDVRPHVFADFDVTPDRVKAFAIELPDVQRRVRAELRHRVADESMTIEFALVGLMLALLGFIVAPANPIHLEDMPLLSSFIFGAILAVVGLVILSPFAYGLYARHERRARAIVWLAAFDDEMSRRQNMRKQESWFRRGTHKYCSQD
ncbi:hypothetical protein [Cryobacterium sp. TMT3-29-2]|uniref:hypothetical protein n=1 Tax=Cryobacterium sp. TMT3-29-2 TaxID=2555867 RepID=UPI00107346D1|nr:hypothetical protein [Cryobacterium sp. TMT3-29-2]TFC86676.1 hypothetical protein E3O67_10290 [Cryobacterium sp. TMT3-29-2]